MPNSLAESTTRSPADDEAATLLRGLRELAEYRDRPDAFRARIEVLLLEFPTLARCKSRISGTGLLTHQTTIRTDLQIGDSA